MVKPQLNINKSFNVYSAAQPSPCVTWPRPKDESARDDVAFEVSDKDNTLDYYVVRPMSSEDTPDTVPAMLDDAFDHLSKLFHEYPTLSCDPRDPAQCLAEARHTYCALPLPPAHCAFQNCDWAGSTTHDLVSHLREMHETDLHDCIAALRFRKGEETADETF